MRTVEFLASSASSRRKRNSDGDRNHTCGCGKQYLSYPALYTHVKLKHHGQFPDGSTSKKPVELARNKVKLDQASRDELKDLRAEMRKYVDKFLSHKDASTQYSSDSRHPREPPTYFDAISLSELFPLEFLNKQHEGDVLHHHLHTVSKQIIDSDDEEDALFESLQDERLDRLIALFMIELGSLVPCKYADFMKESMLVGIFLSDTVKQASGTGEYIAKRIHQFGGSSGLNKKMMTDKEKMQHWYSRSTECNRCQSLLTSWLLSCSLSSCVPGSESSRFDEVDPST